MGGMGGVPLNSKEHEELMRVFEKVFHHYRKDREDKKDWSKGIVYEQPEYNELFKAFRYGVAYGKTL